MNSNSNQTLNIFSIMRMQQIVLLILVLMGCQQATSNPQADETPNTVSDLNQTKIIYCGFDRAKAKALDKTKRMNFHYVGEVEAAHNENSVTCNATYAFYVKRIINRLNPKTLEYTGEQYIDDKIYRLNISYQKIGKEFEYVGANLYDERRGTVQRLD